MNVAKSILGKGQGQKDLLTSLMGFVKGSFMKGLLVPEWFLRMWGCILDISQVASQWANLGLRVDSNGLA